MRASRGFFISIRLAVIGLMAVSLLAMGYFAAGRWAAGSATLLRQEESRPSRFEPSLSASEWQAFWQSTYETLFAQHPQDDLRPIQRDICIAFQPTRLSRMTTGHDTVITVRADPNTIHLHRTPRLNEGLSSQVAQLQIQF